MNKFLGFIFLILTIFSAGLFINGFWKLMELIFYAI